MTVKALSAGKQMLAHRDYIRDYWIAAQSKLCINCAWDDPFGALEARYGPTFQLKGPLEAV